MGIPARDGYPARQGRVPGAGATDRLRAATSVNGSQFFDGD